MSLEMKQHAHFFINSSLKPNIFFSIHSLFERFFFPFQRSFQADEKMKMRTQSLYNPFESSIVPLHIFPLMAEIAWKVLGIRKTALESSSLPSLPPDSSLALDPLPMLHPLLSVFALPAHIFS